MTDNHTHKKVDPLEQNSAPFFVGYLPMPAALKRFYLPLALLLIAACGVAGYWLASQQKSTGPARWNTAAVTTLEGVLTLTPYPVLHRFHPHQPGTVQSVLLVSQGKHSAHSFAAALDGKAVAVDGFEIRRGNWIMLEVAGKQALRPSTAVDTDQIIPLLKIKALGEISLRGEIADSKCYLGVMKPGAGAIHKACAEVCLRGDIPPMLVAKDAHEQKFGYLITRADRSSASKLLARHAAESVQISGQLLEQGDLLFIAMHDDGLRRN